MIAFHHPAGFAGLNRGSSRGWHLVLLFDTSLRLRGALLALVFVFALSSLVSRLQMRACVATHVALHAKRAVASLKSALERCGVAASATEVMMADTVTMD